MNCSRLETLLSDRMDGELHEAVRQAVDEHLGDCGRCRALLDEMRLVRQELAGFPEADPPEGLVRGIMQRTSGLPPERSFWQDLLLPTLRPFLTQRFAFATGLMFVFLSLMVNVLGPGFSGMSASDLSPSSLREGSARVATQVSSYWTRLQDARQRMWEEISLWAEDVSGRLDYHLITGLFKSYRQSVAEQEEKLRQEAGRESEEAGPGEEAARPIDENNQENGNRDEQ